MGITLAKTIKEITRKHLEENGGLLFGECITAIGWIQNTIPNCKGIVELPMTDVAGSAFAVGAAMVGNRPIFVVRFQDFMVLNANSIINYAAKSKEVHGRSTPIFVRALGNDGFGASHSSILHSMFMHFPGIKVAAPMTPGEYKEVWKIFIEGDDPVFCSEYRASFRNTEEMDNIIDKDYPHITLYGIGYPRFAMMKAVEELRKIGIACSAIHILWPKPFVLTPLMTNALYASRLGLVIDSSFEICGAARSIAYELTQATQCMVRALGVKDAAKCMCDPYKNNVPDVKMICDTVKEMLSG